MATRERDLALTATHADGSTLHYAIDYDRGVHEQDGAGGSGASLLFWCNWEERFKFKEILLGYNEIVDGGSGGTRSLSRINPFGYHNGYTNDSSYVDWLYCVDAQTRGEAPLPTSTVAAVTEAGITNIARWPHYKYAAIEAKFVALLHDIYEDADIVVDGETREWLRNCIVEDKPGGKYSQDRQQPYLWTTDQTPVKFAPGFWDPYEDIVVHWLDVPWYPLKAIRNCIGRVNESNILKGARGLPLGIQNGCALLVAAEVLVKPKLLNRRYADITYYIRRIQKPKEEGETNDHGHRELPRIIEVDVSGVNKNRRRWEFISLDGTNSVANGNMLYDEADYDQLFAVPDSADL